jgi:hypothetical protein
MIGLYFVYRSVSYNSSVKKIVEDVEKTAAAVEPVIQKVEQEVIAEAKKIEKKVVKAGKKIAKTSVNRKTQKNG